MNKTNDGVRRLVIRRETLRELNPTDLAAARGGDPHSNAGSDVSNCCCQPTSNQGESCSIKP